MEVMEASPGSSIAVVKFEDYQGNLESKEGKVTRVQTHGITYLIVDFFILTRVIEAQIKLY